MSLKRKKYNFQVCGFCSLVCGYMEVDRFGLWAPVKRKHDKKGVVANYLDVEAWDPDIHYKKANLVSKSLYLGIN